MELLVIQVSSDSSHFIRLIQSSPFLKTPLITGPGFTPVKATREIGFCVFNLYLFRYSGRQNILKCIFRM
jgi:hypothetical protein